MNKNNKNKFLFTFRVSFYSNKNLTLRPTARPPDRLPARPPVFLFAFSIINNIILRSRKCQDTLFYQKLANQNNETPTRECKRIVHKFRLKFWHTQKKKSLMFNKSISIRLRSNAIHSKRIE